MKYRIILASGSPRRREILTQIGASFEVKTCTSDEVMEDLEPAELVQKLSAVKARDVAVSIDTPAVIIGADTVVAYGGKILGKPKDKDDAFSMIKAFAGDVHSVHTGVCIIIKNNHREETELSFEISTDVHVTDMTDEQIQTYIASGEPMDKAGAYAIQGLFAPYISEIKGDYYNIVGFPIASIYHALQSEGINLITGEALDTNKAQD